tara:strand:- start:1365 stop:3245 length:1881 start_codon:yes stop_codon:yes gene_type:complete
MLFENGEFMPDQPDFGNPGSTLAKNVYPSPRGYKPFGGLMYLSTAIDAIPIGAQSLTSQDGTSKVYVGNNTKIYSLDTGATLDRSLQNIALQSDDLDDAVYTKSNVTTSSVTATITNTTCSIYQTITVVAGTVYTLGFKAQAGTASAPLYAIFDVSNSGYIFTDEAYSPADGGASVFAQQSKSFTTPSGCTSIRILLIQNSTGTGTVDIKEVQLNIGSTLGAYSATTDVARTGYTSSATFWDFAAYGDIAVATNYADSPQFMDMSSGVTFADLTTLFRAKTVAVVRDFLMFGNTYDSTDGAKPERIRWSALGDYTDYAISATTQSDYQDTPGGGAVQRIFGGEYAVAMFEHSIYRINYVGSPAVFQFDAVETERGLFTPSAAAQNGSIIYYLDSDGFYAFNGSQSSPIGNERVDRWFWTNLDASQSYRISCAIDHDSKCVVWSFPGQNNVSGAPTHMLLFNFEINRWSFVEQDHELILPLLTSDFTLETLDSLNSDIDDLDLSIDSRVLYEGSSLLGVIEGLKLASNQGSPLTATIESKEMQPSAGRRSHITEVWPLNDSGVTTIQVGVRDRLQDTYSFNASVAVNAQGFAPVNTEGRYVRIRQNISGDWGNSQGADVIAKQRGKF